MQRAAARAAHALSGSSSAAANAAAQGQRLFWSLAMKADFNKLETDIGKLETKIGQLETNMATKESFNKLEVTVNGLPTTKDLELLKMGLKTDIGKDIDELKAPIKVGAGLLALFSFGGAAASIYGVFFK